MKNYLLGLFMLICTIGYSQNTIEGKWDMKESEHVLGPEYLNALCKQITVKQVKDSVIFEVVNLGENEKDVTVRFSVPTNGKPVTNTNATSKRKNVKTFKWNQDKRGFILTIVYHIPENPNEVDFTRVETWKLSPDGKQLLLDKQSIETRSETWQTKGVYVKVFKSEG